MTPSSATASTAAQDRVAELGDLLARTALGDRSAFATLYARSSAHLLGVVLRIQRDRTLAEDLLQDVYVKIWRHAGSFDAQRSQPMTWMASVARNAAIDSLRRRQTEPVLVSAYRPGADDEDDHDMTQDYASDAPSPHDLLTRAADTLELQRCMGHLNGEQQQCLALAFYQGLSHAEVAAHLRQPLGTVKSWVRRGLLSLRECLERASLGTATPAGRS